MSKITDIINGLVTFLPTQLPTTAKEHVNPYALELNDEFGLRDGWSFFIGPVTNTQEMASCQLSVERDIVVNRTLKCYASKEDVSIRRAVELQLLEEQLTMLKEIENDATLNGLLVLATFVGDNGIELIQGEGEVAFLALRSTLTIKYYEQL